MSEHPDDTNPSSARSAAPVPLQAAGHSERISSLAESRLAINRVIGSARRVIRIFDKDLSDSSYRDPVRIQLLESHILAARGNIVQIVLHETRNLERDCARLMVLYRSHAHAFAIQRTVNAATTATDAMVIADEHSLWHRLHQDQPQAMFVIGDNSQVAPLLHRFEEIWESSEPALGATVLGL